MGRSINLSFLLGQHINNKFYNDIDIIIRRFESFDISGILELITVLEILEKSYNLIVNNTAIQLDEYSMIFNEINETFSPTSFKGRISFQILKSLIVDIYPNFSYNMITQRFIRSSIILRPVEYSKPPKISIIQQLFGLTCYKAYDHWLKLSRGYFGRLHIEIICKLHIKYIDLFMIIEESMKNLYEKLNEINSYIGALHGGIPPITYPKYHFLSIGNYGYFESKFKPILEYDDLKPEVYQNFREIGNIISFMKDLSDVMDIRSGFEFINLAPYVGIAPDTNVTNITIPSKTPLGSILHSYKNFTSVDGTTNNSHTDVILTDNLSVQLPIVSDKLCHSINKTLIQRKSLYHGILLKIDEYMNKLNLYEEWSQVTSINTPTSNYDPKVTVDDEKLKLLNLDNSKCFYKLWSVLSFLYCLPVKKVTTEPIAGQVTEEEPQVSDEEEFGHGFTVAGCVFIHLLDQKSLFELYDYSNHILKVYEYEINSNLKGTIQLDENLLADTDEFVDNAITQKKLQEEIFAILESQFKKTEKNNKTIVVFHPSE